ncbi:MAG: hypothetical protein WBY44_18850, partial [Bryobacteraceae bacterium]
MRRLSRWIGCALAAAVTLTVMASFASAQEKKLKDGERELYEPATQAVAGQNWAKAVPALEAWKQKFPESEFKDDRDFYILQGYL